MKSYFAQLAPVVLVGVLGSALSMSALGCFESSERRQTPQFDFLVLGIDNTPEVRAEPLRMVVGSSVDLLIKDRIREIESPVAATDPPDRLAIVAEDNPLTLRALTEGDGTLEVTSQRGETDVLPVRVEVPATMSLVWAYNADPKTEVPDGFDKLNWPDMPLIGSGLVVPPHVAVSVRASFFGADGAALSGTFGPDGWSTSNDDVALSMHIDHYDLAVLQRAASTPSKATIGIGELASFDVVFVDEIEADRIIAPAEVVLDDANPIFGIRVDVRDAHNRHIAGLFDNWQIMVEPEGVVDVSVDTTIIRFEALATGVAQVELGIHGLRHTIAVVVK